MPSMGNQYTKKQNLGLGEGAVVVTFKAKPRQVVQLKRDARASHLKPGPYIRQRLGLENRPDDAAALSNDKG